MLARGKMLETLKADNLDTYTSDDTVLGVAKLTMESYGFKKSTDRKGEWINNTTKPREIYKNRTDQGFGNLSFAIIKCKQYAEQFTEMVHTKLERVLTAGMKGKV